ncbi:hypothetical protein FRC12_005644, partial [Ceratobasidium sp. 428]
MSSLYKDVVREKCRIPAPGAGIRRFSGIPAPAPAPAAGMRVYPRIPAFAGIPAFRGKAGMQVAQVVQGAPVVPVGGNAGVQDVRQSAGTERRMYHESTGI